MPSIDFIDRSHDQGVTRIARSSRCLDHHDPYHRCPSGGVDSDNDASSSHQHPNTPYSTTEALVCFQYDKWHNPMMSRCTLAPHCTHPLYVATRKVLMKGGVRWYSSPTFYPMKGSSDRHSSLLAFDETSDTVVDSEDEDYVPTAKSLSRKSVRTKSTRATQMPSKRRIEFKNRGSAGLRLSTYLSNPTILDDRNAPLACFSPGDSLKIRLKNPNCFINSKRFEIGHTPTREELVSMVCPIVEDSLQRIRPATRSTSSFKQSSRAAQQRSRTRSASSTTTGLLLQDIFLVALEYNPKEQAWIPEFKLTK